MHTKLISLGIAAGLVYALWPKPRFLGDKARAGDLVTVPPSALMSQDTLRPMAYAVVTPAGWDAQLQVLSAQGDILYGRLTNIPPGMSIEPLVSTNRSMVRTIVRDGRPVIL